MRFHFGRLCEFAAAEAEGLVLCGLGYEFDFVVGQESFERAVLKCVGLGDDAHDDEPLSIRIDDRF